ncbi:hypothetical protein CPC16_008708 [Podila verticillata]|nr:hypothetical protein CPC16_008708 [Podila verticillata]
MFSNLVRTLTIVATLLGLFAMAAISFTLYLGHRLLHSVKEPPYPSPPKAPPVCNLDHIEGVTITDAGNILVSLHDNLDIKDMHVTKTYKFSDPSMEEHLDEVEIAIIFADPPRYTLHPVLDYDLDERRRLFYDGHDCATIDVHITFPRGYGFDHLELETRYRSNINIQMQGYSGDDSFNTFKAHTAYGDITDTVIEYIGLGLFVDALVVSGKRAIVGHFTLQSTNRPQVTGYQDVVVNVTKKDRHTLEGTIGTEWMNARVFPRIKVQGHEAILYLKESPPPQEEKEEEDATRRRLDKTMAAGRVWKPKKRVRRPWDPTDVGPTTLRNMIRNKVKCTS